MSDVIRVDVWSDIACPWCYIGKHRFEAGVAEFHTRHPEVEVTIESHSFELAPDTPENFEGSEIDFLVKHKGMPAAQVEEMLTQMTQMAATEDITFKFDTLQHTNTRRAHRVLHLAKSQGLQAVMMERLFKAYFEEGRLISDPATLAELGAEIGLNADEVRDAFANEQLGNAVDEDIARARAIGVSGVPFWLIDEKYGISGAQPATSIAGALEHVLSERESSSA